jgi:hypothetical protein
MANAAVIDRHRDTLLRLLALILVTIGLADDTRHAMRRLSGEDEESATARALRAMAEPGTISRRVHWMIRKLLYPVEAATRRLIIVIAADLPTPKLQPSDIARIKPQLWPWQKQRRRGPATTIKIVTLPRTFAPDFMVPPFAVPVLPAIPPAPAPEVSFKPPVRMPRFCLPDPLKRFNRKRCVHHPVPPRIADAGGYLRPMPVKLPQSPYDQLPDARLLRRVCALASALLDLPKQARRFARWRAFRDAKLTRRLSPLRPGRPPGSPPIRLPENEQREEHTVLAETHSLAWYAQNYPDTS